MYINNLKWCNLFIHPSNTHYVCTNSVHMVDYKIEKKWFNTSTMYVWWSQISIRMRLDLVRETVINVKNIIPFFGICRGIYKIDTTKNRFIDFFLCYPKFFDRLKTKKLCTLVYKHCLTLTFSWLGLRQAVKVEFVFFYNLASSSPFNKIQILKFCSPSKCTANL